MKYTVESTEEPEIGLSEPKSYGIFMAIIIQENAEMFSVIFIYWEIPVRYILFMDLWLRKLIGNL